MFFPPPHSTPSASEEPKERDHDFENEVGNWLITLYQEKRLKERITSRITSRGMRSSVYHFKEGDRWFKLTIVGEVEPELKKEEEKEAESEPQQQKDPNTNNDLVVVSTNDTNPSP